MIHGSMGREDRLKAQEGFRHDPEVQVLLATDAAGELCYRLYTLCERKKRAAEAPAYNRLFQSWPEIRRLASEANQAGPAQISLPGT